MRKKLAEIKQEYSALQQSFRHAKSSYRFKVQQPQGATPQKNLDRPGIIAKALIGDEKMAQLVLANSGDDDKGMRANWTLLTEVTREEIMNKRLYREL